MPIPNRPHLRLTVVTLFALASCVALLLARPALGRAQLVRGDDLALATAWLVAVVASVWLFVVTGACVVALGCARPHLARRLAPALPIAVRRLVEVAILGSTIVIPALPAHAAGPPVTPVAVVADQPVVRTPAAPAPPATPTAPAIANAAGRVVVQPGDNLWLIARTALTSSAGRAPSEAEIARYWYAVIAANRPTLRSGDPSLIFAGEIVTLPAQTAVS